MCWGSRLGRLTKKCWFTCQNNPHFSLAYVKGLTRITALHVLIWWLHKADVLWASKVLGRMVYESAQAISVKVTTHDNSAISICFANAHLSNAGAIRQRHNVFTWAIALSRLQKKAGATASTVIGDWNSQATKEGSLMGSKRVALLAILENLDDSLIVTLSRQSSSEQRAFKEDAFGNKKILPGYCSMCLFSHQPWLVSFFIG